MLTVCMLLALKGLHELYRAFSKRFMPIHLVGYGATVVYYFAIYAFGAGYWLLIVLTFFIITVQTCLVVFYGKLPLQDVLVTAYGFLYVPFLLSFIVLVRQHELGAVYVWLIFISAFGCDTFAYLTGVTLGKRKLVGSPSPSKSLEGLVGGVVGAAVLGLGYGLLMQRFGNPDYTHNIVINAVVIAVVGGGFGIVGDMAASAVKRHTGIKDFGKLFPGHGGLLDRADSLIVIAPMVYLVLNLLDWLPVWVWA